jgi:hypothetical protein
MQSGSPRAGAPLAAVRCAGVIILALTLAGCASKERLEAPGVLASPYGQPRLFAVAPLHNESGVSIVKPDRVADLFLEQLEEVRGVDTVPVNRVLSAMQRLDMRSVSSPRDAYSLMNTLGVDGLIVGTVTAYDPYPPPKLGAAVQLYLRERPAAWSSIDPIVITRAPTERPTLPAPGALSDSAPAAQAAGVFDARNHQTLAELESYAAGRVEPGSPHGSRIYLMSMEMYTQFVAYRLISELLESERSRLNQPPATQPAPG